MSLYDIFLLKIRIEMARNVLNDGEIIKYYKFIINSCL
jgi:hypothetical protein